MEKTTISNHLYNDSISEGVKYISSIHDEESLFVYAYNYNWDDGFEIPSAVLKNPACSLNIALLLFHAADGVLYLQDKENSEGTSTWLEFISNLYLKILNNEFQKGKTAFDPQLSKVQEFKLRKTLSPAEHVFITPFDGIDCYTAL